MRSAIFLAHSSATSLPSMSERLGSRLRVRMFSRLHSSTMAIANRCLVIVLSDRAREIAAVESGNTVRSGPHSFRL